MQISGPNGCGKSTLIKTILGEIKPLAGEISFNNAHPTYLPQLINDFQHFSVTLGEILACSDVHPDIMGLFTEKLLKTRWRDASGGQRQRALIATRIKQDPQVLILDEPFNHLDHEAISTIETLLHTMLSKKYISALIIVSHYPVTSFEDKLRELKLC